MQKDKSPMLDTNHDNALARGQLETLRAAIWERFHEAWNLNDAAHQEEHYRDVEKVARYINAIMNFGYSHEMIMVTAYFHDLFSWSRYNHHLLSAEWIRTTDDRVLSIFSETDRELIAQGCEQHRGSGNEPFKSEFAEMICAADRGFPGDFLTLIRRCMQVHFKKHPYLSNVQCAQWAIEHLKEKYGTGGYARFPAVYHTVFGRDTVANNALIIDSLYVDTDGIFSEGEPFAPFNKLIVGP